MHSSLGSTPADLHFLVCSLPLDRVLCIFCVEYSKGLYRSLGTKTGLLTPTLDVQSASIHAKSYSLEESTSTPTPVYSSGFTHHTSTHAACQSRMCRLSSSTYSNKHLQIAQNSAYLESHSHWQLICQPYTLSR